MSLWDDLGSIISKGAGVEKFMSNTGLNTVLPGISSSGDWQKETALPKEVLGRGLGAFNALAGGNVSGAGQALTGQKVTGRTLTKDVGTVLGAPGVKQAMSPVEDVAGVAGKAFHAANLDLGSGIASVEGSIPQGHLFSRDLFDKAKNEKVDLPSIVGLNTQQFTNPLAGTKFGDVTDVINEPNKLNAMRQHSVLYNVTDLAANIAIQLLGTKGADAAIEATTGAARAATLGADASAEGTQARSAAQTIAKSLAYEDREVGSNPEDVATEHGAYQTMARANLADQLGKKATSATVRNAVQRGSSLVDSIKGLYATAAHPDMDLGTFMQMPVFRTTTNGTSVARAIYYAANRGNGLIRSQVARLLLGDGSARDELTNGADATLRNLLTQDAADQMTSVEADHAQALSKALGTAVDPRKLGSLQRASDQLEGMPLGNGAVRESIPNNEFLRLLTGDNYTTMPENLDFIRQSLSDSMSRLTSDNHTAWWDRLVDNLDSSPDSIFDNLGRVSTDKLNAKTLARAQAMASARAAVGIGESAQPVEPGWLEYANTGGQFDQYRESFAAPTHSVVSWTKALFQKATHAIDLTNANYGSETLASHIDQMTNLVGNDEHAKVWKNEVLNAFAHAPNDAARRAVAMRYEEQAFQLLAHKNGVADLNDAADLARSIRVQRAKAFDGLKGIAQPVMKSGGSGRSIYSAATDANGNSLVRVGDEPVPGLTHIGLPEEGDGGATSVILPIDPSQLEDFHWLPDANMVDKFLKLHTEDMANWSNARKYATAYSEVGSDILTALNDLWRPLQLLSFRWPMRVIGDEAMRAMLDIGGMAMMKQYGKALGILDRGTVPGVDQFRDASVVTSGDNMETTPGQVNPQGGPLDIDPDEYANNPHNAVPFEYDDLDGVDGERYRNLGHTVDQRERHLATGKSPDRFKAWRRTWDDALAETGQGEGFTADPMSNLAPKRTGYAIKTTPGRARGFSMHPTSEQMNAYVRDNRDVFARPDNRLAVYQDGATGTWYLDVVKTADKTKEAVAIAGAHGVHSVYDVANGLAEYAPAGDAIDQADDLFSDLRSRTATNEQRFAANKARRVFKGAGRGRISVKTMDGTNLSIDGAFAHADTDYSPLRAQVSSRVNGMSISSRYAGVRKYRLAQSDDDYRILRGHEDGWSQAMSDFINKHILNSPIWRRMLAGQTNAQIKDYLLSPQGADILDRLSIHNMDQLDELVDWHARRTFEQTFTYAGARHEDAIRYVLNKPSGKLGVGRITPQDVEMMFPRGAMDDETLDAVRPRIQAVEKKYGGHVYSYDSAMRHVADKMLNGTGQAMDKLSGMVDAVVRNPYTSAVYDREITASYARLKDGDVSPEVRRAIHAHAEAVALKSARQLFYSHADQLRIGQYLRNVSPFYNAQLEVIQKYAGLFYRKPGTIAKLYSIMHYPSTVHTPWFGMYDQNGNPTSTYSDDNTFYIQIPSVVKNTLGDVPGFGWLKEAQEVGIPQNRLNFITGGGSTFLPSLGPTVEVPAAIGLRNHPELQDNPVMQAFFPYGLPSGSSGSAFSQGLADFIDAALPQWTQYASAALSGDPNAGATSTGSFGSRSDMAAFSTRVAQIYADLYASADDASKGQGVSVKQQNTLSHKALDMAREEWTVKAISSFGLPFTINPSAPQQSMIDAYHRSIDKYGQDKGVTEWQKQYNAPGDILEVAGSTGYANKYEYMDPTDAAAGLYRKYAGLIKDAPLMLSVLTSPDGTTGTKFSYPVYSWEESTQMSDTGAPILQHLTPAQQMQKALINRGWSQYNQVQDYVNNYLTQQGKAGASTSIDSYPNLLAYKRSMMQQIYTQNPGFQQALSDTTSQLPDFLAQAYATAFSPSLNGRKDIEGLRTYLIGRAELSQELSQRVAAGEGSHTLSYNSITQAPSPGSANYQIAQNWAAWVNQLVASNPAFATLYNSYLASDDLSAIVSGDQVYARYGNRQINEGVK